MYTSRDRNEIIDACVAIGVCHRYNHETPALSDACQIIHGPQMSLYSASKSPDKQHTTSSESDIANRKCYEVRVSPEHLLNHPYKRPEVDPKIEFSVFESSLEQ